MDPLPTTMQSIQKAVDEWIGQFEEGYWPPLSMLAAVVEEIGELAKELNDKEGYKKKRISDKSNLEMELTDVLFSIICIANYYHIDLDSAFKTVVEKYTKRDINRWTRKNDAAP
jgi:NTP pyrophosphatase (non-canonical NTP hydrolase)